ncbi:hypothetical protein KJ885_05285 [Patescibacteria group bacterium]|nr:hypothetical protein [Patescibacteria group bacterium]
MKERVVVLIKAYDEGGGERPFNPTIIGPFASQEVADSWLRDKAFEYHHTHSRWGSHWQRRVEHPSKDEFSRCKLKTFNIAIIKKLQTP